MLSFWPLKAPPQIVGDSKSDTVATSLKSIGVPDRADGELSPYVLLTWENPNALRIRALGGAAGYVQLPYEQQPFIFCTLGRASFQFIHHAGSGKVHLTPIEEY